MREPRGHQGLLGTDRSGRESGRAAVGALLAAVALLVGGTLVAAAFADHTGCTINWVGDVDSSWHTNSGGDTNWDTDALPAAGDHACIGGSASVSAASSATVHELTIDSGATLTTKSTLKITSEATNDGTLILDGTSNSTVYLDITDGNNATTEKLTNNGTLRAENSTSAYYRLYGDLDNFGAIEVSDRPFEFYGSDGGRNFTLDNKAAGTITTNAGGGQLVVENNQTLRSAGEIANGGDLYATGNGGKLTIAGGAALSGNPVGLQADADLEFDAAATASGELEVRSGDSALSGTIPAAVGLTVGAATLHATADVTNEGTLTLDGSGSRPMVRIEDGNNATAEALINQGTMKVTGSSTDPYVYGDLDNRSDLVVNASGHHLRVLAASDGGRATTLTNSGTVDIRSGSRLFPDTGMTQTTGSSTVPAGASLLGEGGDTIDIQGGTLSGGGTVGPNLTNSGTVVPGASPGTLTVTGDYTQTAAGTLVLEVDGAAAGSGFDVLDASSSGDVALAGTLRVEPGGGYVPSHGDEHEAILARSAAGTRTGEFDSVDGGRVGQFTYLPDYRSSKVVLVATDVQDPETTITSGPAEGSWTLDSTPSFAFSSSEPGSFQCSVDGAKFAPCSGPGDSHTTAPLADGEHTFAVWAIDGAGNVDRVFAYRRFGIGDDPGGGGGGGGGGGEPDVPTADPNDQTAPVIAVDAPRRAKLKNKRRSFKAEVDCDELCDVVVKGKLGAKKKKGKGKKRSAAAAKKGKKGKKKGWRKLGRRRMSSGIGTPAEARFRLSRKAYKKVVRWKRSGKKPYALLSIKATDLSGNRSFDRERVWLKPKLKRHKGKGKKKR